METQSLQKNIYSRKTSGLGFWATIRFWLTILYLHLVILKLLEIILLKKLQLMLSHHFRLFSDQCHVHTHPDIFENASLLIHFDKKYLRPHKKRFRKDPRSHEDAAALKILYSNFDRKSDKQNALA